MDLDRAISLYKEAIMEDPDFFMAYYQLATYHFFHENHKEFEENALAAINCTIELSRGEEILKKVLESWLANKMNSTSDLGSQLVELYPDDPDAYLNLGFYGYMSGEYDEAISSFEKTESMGNKEGEYCGPKLALVPLCMLGYTYLITDQLEKSKISFDIYIEKYPNDQYLYDCKGDYYMAIKDYSGAYSCYMKAYNFDTSYQMVLERALIAKNLRDSLQLIE